MDPNPEGLYKKRKEEGPKKSEDEEHPAGPLLGFHRGQRKIEGEGGVVVSR